MSKKDVIIERIGLFKLLVGGAVTVLFLLIFHICTSKISLGENLLIIFGSIIIVIILRWTIKEINKLLEDLKNE